MFFKHIYTPSLAANSYLLGDEKTKTCVAIDPTRHVVPYIVQVQNAGLDIVAILETHVHADFASGSKELKHQLNEKPLIYASGMGGPQWTPVYADRIAKQGTELKIGDLRLEAIHTPGHTPEHLMWVCYDESRSSHTPWFVFTGDCLFVGSVGRPDLLGKNETSVLAARLYHSLFEILAPLPDFVEIFPSHGEGSACGKALKGRSTSTLGYERLFNPYLKKEPEKIWIEHLLKGLSPIPPYFKHLKKMNLLGPPLLSTLKTFKWEEEKKQPHLDELFLIDVRHPDSFAAAHLKGSINIPFSSSFSQWAGGMLPVDMPIGLIVDHTHLFLEIIDELRLMGFDENIWVIQLEKNRFLLPDSFHSLTSIPVEELAKHAQSEPPYILDVRTLEEWQSGHIPGAHHLELNMLVYSLDELPQERSIAVVCRSGHRASIGASLLKKHGFSSVMNVCGGMLAWKQAKLPMIKGNKNLS